MNRWLIATALLLGSALVWAEQQAPQVIRVIPKAYVSPGASGSIDGYQRQQQYDIIGGQAIPRGGSRIQIIEGSQQFETRGGIRQSTEYPGGYEVQRYPGQGIQYQQRR